MALKHIAIRLIVSVRPDEGEPAEFDHTLGYDAWTPDLLAEYKRLVGDIRGYMSVKLKQHVIECDAKKNRGRVRTMPPMMVQIKSDEDCEDEEEWDEEKPKKKGKR